MDSVEDYARQCAKRDKEQLDTLFWMGDDWWGHWCKLELTKTQQLIEHSRNIDL